MHSAYDVWSALKEEGFEIIRKGQAITATLPYNTLDHQGDVYQAHSIKFKMLRDCDINSKECLKSGICTGEC
jgi:hypothetical protein